MSLYKKPVAAPDPVNPQSLEQSQNAADNERRQRAQKGGRGATFLWDAAPITAAPKPSTLGSA
ncbi:hypothetical protein [Asticcacaulis taihuensis]|uniref:hypothetical protein n=1 Tax=Asticcacaulis taihuensis TaxID=260084 RepID=UPI0026ECC8EA|nr:hypothetical protein [Asticcacaulis taihuensis]